MSAAGLNDKQYLEQLEREYGEGRRAEFKKESDKVLKYFKSFSERLSEQYVINSVLAVGGTGVVHTGTHKRFRQPVVVKINRPNVEAEEAPMVENEARVLPTLSHPNIIRVFDIGEDDALDPKLTYIVEPLIEGAKALFKPEKERQAGTWLYGKLQNLKQMMPLTAGFQTGDGTGQSISAITDLLRDIAFLFSQWVDLLRHLHARHDGAEEGYVYLDVKPENVLVDEHLHLTSIDYGSVERIDQTDKTPLKVFFTERYAHPALLGPRKIHKPSSNRVTGSIKRNELRTAFDLYALGESLLEILHEVASIRPHVVPQLPLYRSLHFLATRLLDGRNQTHPENEFPLAPQVFPSLKDSDYRSLGYQNLYETHRDLDKERGRWILEMEVPELATYSKDIVRVVPHFNMVLTSRLRAVIEHPLVARLKLATQLGLVSLVYPTADHSRYDHALGSYTYTTFYVKSLFNDLGNPIFRNLVGREDINTVLLAALLHDLGQYPLAHDLEEVHERIFNHSRIGMELLKDTSTDRLGRTLLQIIEDPQGWNVNADALRSVLGASSQTLTAANPDKTATLKTNVLASIIDGQVDADKADYIVRDSARCELPYGAQLDIERLLRVLTVAILPEETSPQDRISLGVYDKGLVSAHAFGLARYQLLTTVYWHHTSRILKCMLQYATAMALPLEVFGPQSSPHSGKELELRQQLLAFIKGLVPPFETVKETLKRAQPAVALDLLGQPPEQVIDIINDEGTDASLHNPVASSSEWYPGISWSDWLMLEWIAKLTTATTWSRNLIAGIQSRRLYKRVATFEREGPYNELIGKLDELPWPSRIEACKELHKKIYTRLKRDWSTVNTVRTIEEADFEKLSDSNLLVLIDNPNPRKKTGYRKPLGVVPELKEKLYQQSVRQAAEDKAWRNIMEKMVESSAPVRILCHPEIRNLVNAVYAANPGQNPAEKEIAKDVLESITEAVDQAKK